LNQIETHRQSENIGNDGFTLVEILIALVLLGISIAVLAQLFSTNLRNIGKSQNYLPAVVLAEARMSEFLAKDVLDEKNVSYQSDDGYLTEVSVVETMKDKFHHLPVKLMEIGLTVRWHTDQKEKIFMLQSYKIVKRAGFPEEAEKKNEKTDEEQPAEKK
jgi:prepilin-type N-terminal cleavage/methylation domain-containing protein